MNVALSLTAAYHGATVANHCEVINLTKNEEGIVNGAIVRDVLTGEEWAVKAKVGLYESTSYRKEAQMSFSFLGCHQCHRSIHRRSPQDG